MPWILLWILISTFLIGIFIWSLDILLRQKREWGRFAKRHGLEYNRGKLMQSPIVAGELGGYSFHLYSEEQLTAERNGRQFRTVLHFALPDGMPSTGFIATPDYKQLADTLELSQTIKLKHKEWPKNNVGRTDGRQVLEPYFTDQRVKAIARLTQMKKASTVFVFDPEQTYLRVETADPLQNADKIDRITQRMIKVADALALQEGEAEELGRDQSARTKEDEAGREETDEHEQARTQDGSVKGAEDDSTREDAQDSESAEGSTSADDSGKNNTE